MTKVTTGFFSFTEVTSPDAHHSYNEWHQLDHMPEQFPLEGIAYGQRWVWPPARRTNAQGGSVATPPFDRVHYVTLYLMQEPLDETLTEFLDWGKELGRRGRFHTQRHAHLSGPFALVDARASERVLVSAEAVPYRPHRGIRVTVEALSGDDTGVARYDEWCESRLTPDMCAVDGVAGVWRFASSSRFDNHVWRTGPRRITVTWIDGDLDSTSTHLAQCDAMRTERSAGATTIEMAATLETITPWQWDWFNGA